MKMSKTCFVNPFKKGYNSFTVVIIGLVNSIRICACISFEKFFDKCIWCFINCPIVNINSPYINGTVSGWLIPIIIAILIYFYCYFIMNSIYNEY